MCNNYKKPTGATGGIEDRVNCCIEIDCRIQHSTNSGLLGASSGEDDAGAFLNSDSSCSEESSVQEDSQDPDDFVVEEEDEDEEQDPTAAFPVARIAVNQNTTNAAPNVESDTNTAGCIHARGPAASGSTPRRKSPTTSKNSVSSGKSGGKTKNSSNKEQGSVLKTMDRIASSFEHGVGDGAESAAQFGMMMMMQQQSQANMQAQMQQQQWQQFQTMQQMQLQQIQQSMQNQIAAMDRRANKTDKILRRLVKESRSKKKQRHHDRDSDARSSGGESSESSSDN